MGISSTFITRSWLSGLAFVGFAGLVACTTDDNDPGVDADVSSDTASTTTETTSTGSGGTSSTGSAHCAISTVLDASSPGIAAFDDYDGSSDLSTWSFPLGGDVALGVFAGPFGYGDEADGSPETFEMVEGHDSTYALGISDSDSEEYGGGMGTWISTCLDARAFAGISLWVRGNAPTGDAKLSVLMEETTPDADGETVGTCSGTLETCLHPTFTFPVTDEWTEVEVAWNDLTPGQTPDAVIEPDGRNIWQVQFDIGLVWEEGDSGEYVPVPGEYELVIDDLAFY